MPHLSCPIKAPAVLAACATHVTGQDQVGGVTFDGQPRETVTSRFVSVAGLSVSIPKFYSKGLSQIFVMLLCVLAVDRRCQQADGKTTTIWLDKIANATVTIYLPVLFPLHSLVYTPQKCSELNDPCVDVPLGRRVVVQSVQGREHCVGNCSNVRFKVPSCFLQEEVESLTYWSKKHQGLIPRWKHHL